VDRGEQLSHGFVALLLSGPRWGIKDHQPGWRARSLVLYPSELACSTSQGYSPAERAKRASTRSSNEHADDDLGDLGLGHWRSFLCEDKDEIADLGRTASRRGHVSTIGTHRAMAIISIKRHDS
jgi:hypothetical protein